MRCNMDARLLTNDYIYEPNNEFNLNLKINWKSKHINLVYKQTEYFLMIVVYLHNLWQE